MALLAAHLMLDAYRLDGSIHHLIEGASFLEYCLRYSKWNFQAKVLLIQFYKLLGILLIFNRV